MKWVKVLMVVVAVIGVVVPLAQASSIIISLPPTITPIGGGVFTWTYTASMADARLLPGDFLVVYDFAQFVGFPALPPLPLGWAAGVQLVGPIPGQTTPVDNAGILNLVFTYGGIPLATAPPPPGGSLFLGVFSANSMGNIRITGEYAAQDANWVDLSLQANLGYTSVPAIPLPAAGWAGLSLLGVLGLRRRSR